MKFFIYITIITALACKSAEKTTAPILFNPQKPAENSNSLIPFTRELYNKIKESKVDINKLKFYVSNTVILNQGIVKNDIGVGVNGELQTTTQTNEKLIELLALTPGVIESIDSEGIMIRFEKGDKKALRFVNNKYSPVYFSLSGNNWNNGTALVDYANTSYLASCGDCNSLTNVKLLIKKITVETVEKEVSQPTGMSPQ